MLSVLDGAVLVVSAVEGVQPQTRVLMRALQRLRIPTLVFVNKIDRAGADDERVLREIAERLTPATVAMTSAASEGTRAAGSRARMPVTAFGALVEVLAEHDDALLAAYVDDEASVSSRRLRDALAAQTERALVHPVFFGSAITGAGVDSLTAGHRGAAAGRRGRRGRSASRAGSSRSSAVPAASGSRTSGCSRAPSARVTGVHFGRGRRGQGDRDQRLRRGTAVQRAAVSAGEIAKLWGLAEIRIGDRIGEAGRDAMRARVRPADARVGRRPELAGRHGQAPRRARRSSPSRTR